MSFTQVVRSRRTDSNHSRPRILAGNPVDRASGASQASVNADVADAFDEMAELLAIRGDNRGAGGEVSFSRRRRVRPYRAGQLTDRS